MRVCRQGLLLREGYYHVRLSDVRFLRQFSNLILVEATCLYCSGIPEKYFLSLKKFNEKTFTEK